MAEDKRISELSPIPTVTPGALFPVVDEITGETMSARFDQMAATVDLDDYALKTYVDAQDIATLDDAKDYADLQDVTNLNAAKAYADGLVVGLWDDRGNFNASVNAYPSSGGSGTAGAIKKGDIWTVSVAGILPSSQSVEVGDTVRALVDTPGNTQANWSIQQNNIGYTAENSANKTNTVTGNEASTTLYASVKGFVDYLVGMTWLTSTIFGAWIVGNTAKSTPVGGDSILISDLSDSNKTKKTTLTELWTNYLRAFVFSATLTTNRVPKSNGSGILADSNITDNGTTITLGTNTSINGNITMPINGQIDVTGNYLQLGANTSTTGVLIGRSGGDMLFNGTTGGLNFNNGGGINNTANQINYRSSLSVDNGKTDGTTYTQHRGEQCFRHSIVLSPNTQLSPNAACSIDLQVTTKGTGLNLVPNASKPTGRKGNFLMNDTNSVLEFTTGTGSNWQELAVYKFDELLQITDCNATFATANTGVYFPFVPKCDMNVTKIYYNLQSAGTDTVRVAIYSDSSNTPTTLLVQSSEATTGATPLGQRSITISSTRLLAGTRYWIAIKNDNGATGFLNKNDVYSNNITREGFTSGAFVGSPAPSSAVNAIWLGIGI